MNISVNMDVRDVTRWVAKVHKKQIPFAASQALNDTAFQARTDVMDAMAKYLDRPTPWTKRGIRVNRASKRTLRAEVLILDNRWKYLKYQTKGGTRQPNNKAIAVPVEQRRNKYGNMTRGAVAKLLAKPNVFSGQVNGVPGIYQRVGGRNPRTKLLVYWVPVVEYEARFPFQKIVQQSVKKNFKKNFDRRLAAAIRSAR